VRVVVDCVVVVLAWAGGGWLRIQQALCMFGAASDMLVCLLPVAMLHATYWYWRRRCVALIVFGCCTRTVIDPKVLADYHDLLFGLLCSGRC
jgi:hypothetical protein